MARHKTVFLKDIKIKETTKSAYIKNKNKYINKTYNFLYLKDIVCSETGYVYGVCDCIKCGNKDIVTALYKLINFQTLTCGCSREAGSGFHNKYASDEYIGKVYGNLRVDSYFFSEHNDSNGVYWNTTCLLCGNKKTFKASLLVNGTTVSCGCKLSARNNKYSTRDWVGKDINGTVVLDVKEKAHDGQRWLCRCKYCGKEFNVLARKIVSGHTNSCGCQTESLGIIEIKKWLINNNIKFVQEWKHPTLLSKYGYNLRIDFAILNKDDNVIAFIEYDGNQHYDPFSGFGKPSDYYSNYLDIVDSDNIKNKFAYDNNIRMIRIIYSRNSKDIISKLDSNKSYLIQ